MATTGRLIILLVGSRHASAFGGLFAAVEIEWMVLRRTRLVEARGANPGFQLGQRGAAPRGRGKAAFSVVNAENAAMETRRPQSCDDMLHDEWLIADLIESGQATLVEGRTVSMRASSW
ncbi:hypothetical protein K461DRAFT_135375 [Myriangium duriaei CBS 260.36]|uniref:Uncharacterized protein n=1 Tax=Myriangium duriaei CBS 260.36 TaxID=1168546 RepID=A0A9P4J4K9_9PEZI|nr:hypothetical protein K461DRAFT_135375 [Myriangium duriaei CBS 260.36]